MAPPRRYGGQSICLVTGVISPTADAQATGWTDNGLIKFTKSLCNSTCSSSWVGENSGSVRREETSRQGWTERKEIPFSKCRVGSFRVGIFFPGTGGSAVSYLKVPMISQVGFLSKKRAVLIIFPVPGLKFIFKCLLDFMRN